MSSIARIISPARRLILAYAAAEALLYLSVFLTGNPFSLSGSVLAIDALIVWGLWRGSVVAWVVALAFAVLGFLTIPLLAPPHHVSVFVMLAVYLVQVLILCTRDVRAFVDGGGRDLPVLARR